MSRVVQTGRSCPKAAQARDKKTIGRGVTKKAKEGGKWKAWAELKQDLSLSRRQADVVEQLLQGHSDKQIARELQMSVPTVRTHLCRLFSRFGVEDRCELIVHVYARSREKCMACGCPRAQ